MRSYSRKRKNNIIIGTLCGVMLLMVVGYAAFASQLNIKGTSGISSNWDIEITNIRGGNPNGGDAYDISEPTYTLTTATFNTGLKTPGTDRWYEVEVTNKGTLTGLVTIANLSCGDNDVIGCDAAEYDKKIVDDNWNVNATTLPNGIGPFEQGQQYYSNIQFTIAPGEKHYIYVNVWYEDVISQPENLSANINLELTYEQADGNNVIQGGGTFTGTIYRDYNGYYLINGKSINETVLMYYPSEWSSIDDAAQSGWLYVNEADCLAADEGPCTSDSLTLNTGNYSKNPSSLGNKYLKHVIENDIVQESYVCFVTDTEHCMQGGNPSYYENNRALLQSQESWFTNNGGRCTFDDSYFECWDAGFHGVVADSEGNLYASTGSSAYSDFGVTIQADGLSY